MDEKEFDEIVAEIDKGNGEVYHIRIFRCEYSYEGWSIEFLDGPLKGESAHIGKDDL